MKKKKKKTKQELKYPLEYNTDKECQQQEILWEFEKHLETKKTIFHLKFLLKMSVAIWVLVNYIQESHVISTT